jgi:flagellar hook-associated protein 1 FlgK
VARDPSLLATSSTGASGDNGVLLDLLRAADAGVGTLGERTLSGFYGDIVGDVGFSVRSTANAMEVEQFVADSLEARREAVSGVNVDEELVDMIRFEQAFAAAAQYIQVINQTQDELLSLL